jgi:anthranilate/para-aminobenzoate synthase component I
MGEATYFIKRLVKPSISRVKWDKSPLEVFTALCDRSDYAYLLESVEGPEKIAEYSFVGFEPSSVIA